MFALFIQQHKRTKEIHGANKVCIADAAVHLGMCFVARKNFTKLKTLHGLHTLRSFTRYHSGKLNFLFVLHSNTIALIVVALCCFCPLFIADSFDAASLSCYKKLPVDFIRAVAFCWSEDSLRQATLVAFQIDGDSIHFIEVHAINLDGSLQLHNNDNKNRQTGTKHVHVSLAAVNWIFHEPFAVAPQFFSPLSQDS